MIFAHEFPTLSEPDLVRLADDVAFFLQPGDLLTLSGGLGAGKTTLARALLRTLSLAPDLEVPSPTFTLVQTYDTPRFPVAHFDLYRVSQEGELDELGLEAALKLGVAFVEWPERAGRPLADERLDIRLDDISGGDARSVKLSASEGVAARLKRLVAIREFLAQAGWGEADTRLGYLQGDASPRRYARLTKVDGSTTILMDSPRRPDGPAIRNGQSYSAIAHLAEDVRPFVAISGALGSSGFAVPKILACDLASGLLLIDDLGDRVFASEVMRGADQAHLWQRATDTLARLRCFPPPASMPLPDGSSYRLPVADKAVLHIETELLLDWYWPAILRVPPGESERAEFNQLWSDVIGRVLTGPRGWMLRDYHSPNLIDLADQDHKVGILDFQDALEGPPAYDVVSLLQDARVDVPEALELELLSRYVRAASANEPPFDEDEFRFAYAALGAQRNTKILGIFARLAKRDGKRHYLAHIPRIWGYLERDLKHEGLRALAAWYDRCLPRSRRADALCI